MRSLLKVMKTAGIPSSEDVVQIPDILRTDGIDFTAIGDHAEGEKLKQFYDHMMNQAQEKSQQLSNRMMQQANRSREELLMATQEKCLQLCEQAKEEGYTQGIRQRTEEIDSCFVQVQQQLAQMREEQLQFIEEYSNNLQILAVEIASKVIATKIAQDDLILVDLVRKAIGSVKGADWISVELCEDLPKLLEYLGRDLHRKEQELGVRRIELSPGDRPADTCIIRTDEGTVDASVSTQLENLLECFARLK